MVGPEDYDEFCTTVPTDSRLPGGGGQELCGLYDINPSKFGQVEEFRTFREPFGNDQRLNQFIGVQFDARLPNGMRIGGGVDTGRTIVDRCFVVDSPQELLNCRVVTPWGAQTQFKLNGVIPLPYDINLSATYQNLSGGDVPGNYSVRNSDIRWTEESLANGRIPGQFSGGSRSQTVEIFSEQTLFLDRLSRLDFRASKIINRGRVRVQINFDAYNLLNVSTVRSVAEAFGPAFLTPRTIIDPRLLQVGGNIAF